MKKLLKEFDLELSIAKSFTEKRKQESLYYSVAVMNVKLLAKRLGKKLDEKRRLEMECL